MHGSTFGREHAIPRTASADVLAFNLAGGKSGVFQPGGPQQALNRPSAQYANVYAERVMQLGVAVPSTAALLHMHAQQQVSEVNSVHN